MNKRAPFPFPAVPAAVITALAAAVVAAGGSQAIASRLGLPALQVAQWMNGQAALPAEHCPAIEEMSGTRCEDLRPDLHWIRASGEVLGFLTPVDGADAAYVMQSLRNESTAGETEDVIDGQWPASAYVAGMMRGMGREAAAALLRDHYPDNIWTHDKLDSLAADVAEATDHFSAATYCMGMLRGLSDADHDRILAEHAPRGWNGWTEQKSDAVWAEAEAIRQRANAPASRSLTVADVDRLAAAARDVLGDIHNLKDLFARGELVRKSDGDSRPWPVAAISESGQALDQACGDVLEKLAKGFGKKPPVMHATKGGEEAIPVHGAMLNLAIPSDASIEDCFSDGLCYLDSGIAAGLEKSDDFDQSMWAAFHLLSLGRGLIGAAQSKLYAFDRQQVGAQ